MNITLLETNMFPPKVVRKMIFLFLTAGYLGSFPGEVFFLGYG